MVEVLMREIPKYTQYELSNNFKNKLDELSLNKNDASIKYGIEESILNDIMDSKVMFKRKHYLAVQNILNISEDELFAQVEKPTEVYYRATQDSEEIKEVVEKIDILFNEWIFQKKIYGK